MRQYLGLFVISTVITIAMVVGWYVQLDALFNIVFLVLGAALTYSFETITQRRTWKREYAVKIVEQVYGQLFENLQRIIRHLKDREYIYWIQFDKWREFQQDHRYFMVDQNFRIDLDQFEMKLEAYFKVSTRFGSETLPKMVAEEIERIFGIKTSQIPTVEVSYNRGGYTHSTFMPQLDRCLVTQSHPTDVLKRSEPNASEVTVDLTITSVDNKRTTISDPARINEFWMACLKTISADVTYDFIVEESERILLEAYKLRHEIVKRIEQPWRI